MWRRLAIILGVLATAACGLQATPPPGETDKIQLDQDSPDHRLESSHTPWTPPRVAEVENVEPPARRRHPVVVTAESGIISQSGEETPVEVRRAHLAQVERMRCPNEPSPASYPPQFDDWHRIDLDEDGQHEYVVFLTLEGFGGGNNYSRYLIVYRYVEPVWFASRVALVGGKGGLMVSGDTVRIADRVFSTDAMFPDDDDATCCPSVRGTIEYDIGIGGALTPRLQPLPDRAASSHILLLFVAACE